MAEENKQYLLSMIVTTSEKVKDIIIKDGQLIFVKDKRRIALDLHGNRKFYNDIGNLETEQERINLTDIEEGFYYVEESNVLYHYKGGWNQVGGGSNAIIFSKNLPATGVENQLYIDLVQKTISIWDDTLKEYVKLGGDFNTANVEDIEKLF